MIKNIKLNNDDIDLIVNSLIIRSNRENKDIYLIDQIDTLIDELKTQKQKKENNMKTIEQIKSTLSEVSQLILDGQYLYDLIHEEADGSSDVIYYYNAKQKVEAATCEQIEAAEEQFHEYGMRFKSLGDLHCKLAYFIIVDKLAEEYNDNIKNDIESLETLISEYECEHNHDIELVERVEEIQELIDQLEDV